jgi:alanyl-tRNA synthetase
MTSKDIRQQFLDFFTERHGHTLVPSSPVVPLDDPTLLFANAGMNQFKQIFLGTEKRSYTRAVDTQKCIRAGGKHNDLDDVGRSRRHHTFFEMLGNWSFGDYFKRGAIEMAWELLTKVWKLDPARLHATCFEGDPARGIPRDEEAAKLWKEIARLPDDQIHFHGFKDNFWLMGDTGPCGPCSEIHIDLTPDKSGGRDVNGDNPAVMEIWNLVFIQFNRHADGHMEPLPSRHVDTGMGFERICRVLQNKPDNYAIDLWQPYFAKLTEISGRKYAGTFPSSDTGGSGEDLSDPRLQTDIALRAIADHARMATFAINDGCIPSNKTRGSVLRSVIRRAVRFGYQVLEVKRPFLHEMVGVVVESMGDAFPELTRDPRRVESVIRGEEEAFLSVIERGLRAFDEAAKSAGERSGRVFAGADLFNLHATLGFPADMAMQLARERGLTPDKPEYDRLWEEHARISKQGARQHTQVAVDLSAFVKTDDSPKYHGLATEGAVLGWIAEDKAVTSGQLTEDAQAALLLNRTTFYAEQGGQIGDVGIIQTPTGRFEVTSTERKGDWVLHWGIVAEGHIEPDQQAMVQVDSRRSDTMRNHTATHLLNFALRKVLGDHIEQKGSLVDDQKLRFDFSHPQAVTSEQLAAIERIVNERIYSDLPVSATTMPLSEAKKLPGVRAVFGEKYPDPVRVIAVGTDDPRRDASIDHSIEFCGGTHLKHTGEAGFFKVVSEESVSKGVRRITAVTGRGAVEYVQNMENSVRTISQTLSAPVDEAPKRIAGLQEEIRQLKKKLQTGGGAKIDPSATASKLLSDAPALGPGKLIVAEIADAADEQLRGAMDSLKKKAGSYAIMLASANEGKVSFVAAVSDDLIAKGLKAGDWIRQTAQVAGGGGGGRPQMAQAGGKDPGKIADALETARRIALSTVK